MPLPTGTWTINLNGALSQLSINTVDPAGNVTGTLAFGNLGAPISGFWDELAQKLVFAVLRGGFTYRGFLFTDTFRMPGLTGNTVFTLAGSFDRVAGGTADRPTFGWYAQIGTA